MKGLLSFVAALATATGSYAALFELDLGPTDETGAGLHPGNAIGNVTSLGSGGELNTRDPSLEGITYDSITKVLEINIGWGSAFGFTDLADRPTRLEIGGPTDVPKAEGNTIYSFLSTHPGFSGEQGTDGTFRYSITLQNNPGSLTYSVEQQEQDLLNGLWYLNLRTRDYQGGEIRGQLTAVPEPAEWGLFAGGALLVFAGVRSRLSRSC